MTNKFVRGAGALTFAAAVTLGLAACSSNSPEEDPIAPTTESTSSTAPVETSEAAQSPEAEETAESSDQAGALAAFVEENQAAIPSLLESAPDTYSEIRIVGIEPSTMSFEYVYLEETGGDEIVEYFDSLIPTLQTTADTLMIPDMENNGITEDPKVRFAYYNPDGSEIWSHTFEKES